MLETSIERLSTQPADSPNEVWIEALPARTYHTPQYGEVTVPVEKLQRMVKNFKENVRGQEIATDFNHGLDRAKGDKASGWYRDFQIRPSSSDPQIPALWSRIELTEEAQKEIADKQWKYFSLEWDDEWVSSHDGSKHADVIMGGGFTNRPIAKHTLPINFSESMWDELSDDDKREVAFEVVNRRMVGESKEWEHSEPGISSPPPPRTDEDGSDEPDRKGGWRVQTPPIAVDPVPEGVNTLSELLSDKDVHELKQALDLDYEADGPKIVETVKIKFGELHSLREAVSAADQEKVFAEQYPQYWSEHRKLMERDRENTARTFSESVSKVREQKGYGLVETKQGLSTLAQDKIIDVHKKFSEGTATVDDFEECIKAITQGGILKFGEIGNSNEDNLPEFDTSSATGVVGARKIFAEVVSKVQTEHPDWDYMKCVAEAGKKHPDLADAYKVTLPA